MCWTASGEGDGAAVGRAACGGLRAAGLVGGEVTIARFRCGCCGNEHDGPPFAYAFAAPALWSSALEEQPGNTLGEETCERAVGDERHFFVRGRIRISVVGAPDPFEWGAWVSLAEANYRRMIERWNDPARPDEQPYFGWLSTNIPIYPPTVGLKANLHTQQVGTRPLIELEPTDHPLAVEQRTAITIARVEEIASLLLHPVGPPLDAAGR